MHCLCLQVPRKEQQTTCSLPFPAQLNVPSCTQNINWPKYIPYLWQVLFQLRSRSQRTRLVFAFYSEPPPFLSTHRSSLIKRNRIFAHSVCIEAWLLVQFVWAAIQLVCVHGFFQWVPNCWLTHIHPLEKVEGIKPKYTYTRKTIHYLCVSWREKKEPAFWFRGPTSFEFVIEMHWNDSQWVWLNTVSKLDAFTLTLSLSIDKAALQRRDSAALTTSSDAAHASLSFLQITFPLLPFIRMWKR